MLPIFPVTGRGFYAPDILCNGSWSLLPGLQESSLELKIELKSDALLVTTIDFSGLQTHDSLHTNRVF